MAIFEAFCAFFLATLPGGPFFLDSRLLSSGNTAVEADARETLQNKGFRSDVAAFYVFEPFGRVDMARFCGSVLRIIFLRGLLFSTVRCSKFCRNWVSRVKKPLGLQNRARFEKAIFRRVSAARANLARGGRGARPCHFFSRIWGSLPKMSSRLRCGGFFRLFRFFLFDPFSQTSSGSSSHPPFFLWVFFLFCSHSSWDWGQRPIASVFLGSWPSTLLIFWGCFGVFIQKHCFFPLKKGLFWFISQCLPFVSPFRSPWFFSLLFVTLSFIFFCFSFLVVLFLCLSSLFFVVFFLSCFSWKTTSKDYMWKLSYHKLFVFIFLFRLSHMFLSLLFHYLSCVFWWTSMFFFSIFPRRPFLKHQFWFHTLWKVIVFRAHFDWEKFWLMFKKHCRNRYFSTLLRAIKMKQIPFWGVVLWSE